jgi:plastocyanin
LRGFRLISILVALGATMLTGGVAAAGSNVVHITSTLDPATITIAPGERITWRNDDDERHRIRTTSGPTEFDSGNLEPGQAFRVTLSRPGRYEYYDHRNDELTRYYGTVLVQDGATADPQDPDVPGAESPSRATIAIGDRVFRPGNVTIAAGGSVTWRNDDDREHTATASDGAFDTGVLSPGESARESFPKPGTFSFLCLIHPDMTGTVTVTGSGGGAPLPPPTPEPTSRPDDPGPDPEPAANDVVIRDFQFTPTELTVDEGARVTFDNHGSAGHTVTADDGSFDSGLISPGASWDHTFATSGTFAFICAFHPQMAATIRVRDPGGASPASPTTSPTLQATPTPAPSGAASPPTDTEPADPAGGAAVQPEGNAGDDAGAAAASRDIGAVLLGIAAGGGMLLIAGAGIAVVRAPRDPGPFRREIGGGGR